MPATDEGDGGMRRAARWMLVALGLVASSLVGVAATPDPASAATTLTVTPTTGLADGDTLDITVSGSDAPRHVIAVCANDARDDVDSYFGVWLKCRALDDDPYGVIEIAPGESITVEMPVHRSMPIIGGLSRLECGGYPGQCVVADIEVGEDFGRFDPFAPVTIAAREPISFFDEPVVTVTPDVALPPSGSVQLRGTGFEDGTVLVRACSAAWAAAPNATTVDAACGPPTSTTSSAGIAAASIAVTDPLRTVDGTEVPCSFEGCVLVAGYGDEPVAVSAPLAFSQPTVETSPTQNLPPNGSIQVTVRGLPEGSSATVAHCRTAEHGGGCGTSRWFSVIGGVATGSIAAPAHWDGSEARYYSCQQGACELRVRSSPDPDYLDVTIPLTYAPAPELLVDPVEDLLTGDELTVRGIHLTPGAGYQVAQCNPSGTECDPGTTVVASGSGEVSTTIEATDHMGRFGYCQEMCTVRLRAVAGGEPDLRRTVAFVWPTARVSKDTGVVDGEAIELTGTNISPTYAGTPLFLPTGSWGISQCPPGLGGYRRTDLVTLLTSCGTAGTSGPIAVVDNMVHATVRPTATITPIIGNRSYDCRRADICRIVLSRWEQDGTVSLVQAQDLNFAP